MTLDTTIHSINAILQQLQKDLAYHQSQKTNAFVINKITRQINDLSAAVMAINSYIDNSEEIKFKLEACNYYHGVGFFELNEFMRRPIPNLNHKKIPAMFSNFTIPEDRAPKTEGFKVAQKPTFNWKNYKNKEQFLIDNPELRKIL